MIKFNKTDPKPYIIRMLKSFHDIPKHYKLNDLELREEISVNEARYYVYYKNRMIAQYTVNQ